MVDTMDELHMARCIELARRAEGRTAPNPLVGCVIVGPDGRVLAEGWHRRAGQPHAEIDALQKLGGKAPGATLYCNLEPCNHRKHRRTAPCAPALAEAGIARLVIAMGDPIPSHAGGAAWLARRGVKVFRGVLREQAAELNRPFVTWARHGRPLIVLKAAVTLDGKVATRAGESQWITGPAARKHGHGLRNRLDAILVGVGTVLADDPRLTCRGVRGARDPVRIILDSTLRTPLSARVLPQNSDSPARVIIATTDRAARSREKKLTAAGAEVWRVAPGPRVDPALLLARLAAAEITSVLVEGGAGVHGSLLDAGLVDDILLYVAPMVVGGGSASPAWAAGSGVSALADARRFVFTAPPEPLGPDLLLRARAR